MGRLVCLFRSKLRKRGTCVAGRPFQNSRAVSDYLTPIMAFAELEEVRALYLSEDGMLLEVAIAARGTRIQAPICPRTILRRALELDAAGLIIAHNHPSGDPTPSRADIQATREIYLGARNLGITLRDHVIVARGGWSSFHDMGLL